MSQEILNDTAGIVIDSDAIKESISDNQDDWSDAWTQCGIFSTQSRQRIRHWEMFWTTQQRILFVSSLVTDFICLIPIYYDLLRAGNWKALSRIICYTFLSLKFKQCAVHLKKTHNFLSLENNAKPKWVSLKMPFSFNMYIGLWLIGTINQMWCWCGETPKSLFFLLSRLLGSIIIDFIFKKESTLMRYWSGSLLG